MADDREHWGHALHDARMAYEAASGRPVSLPAREPQPLRRLPDLPVSVSLRRSNVWAPADRYGRADLRKCGESATSVQVRRRARLRDSGSLLIPQRPAGHSTAPVSGSRFRNTTGLPLLATNAIQVWSSGSIHPW